MRLRRVSRDLLLVVGEKVVEFAGIAGLELCDLGGGLLSETPLDEFLDFGRGEHGADELVEGLGAGHFVGRLDWKRDSAWPANQMFIGFPGRLMAAGAIRERKIFVIMARESWQRW